MADYSGFWWAIAGGDDWDLIKDAMKDYASGDKRKFNNLNRQKNRVRAYIEGRSVQRRSGKHTAWVHDVVAIAIARLGGFDADEVFLSIFPERPPAGYELRGYLKSLSDVAEYVKVIPLNYVAIVPTRSGWAIYVQS